MASISNFLENKILEHTLGVTTYAKPTPYVALFTTDPTESGTGTEVSTSGTGYTRIQATFGTASGGSISNSADITFPVATSSFGTVSHIGIYDAATAGNLLWHGALTTSKTVQSTDQFKISTGSLTITLD